MDSELGAGGFRALAKSYRAAWPVRLAGVEPDGQRRFASGWWKGSDPAGRRETMAWVIQEGLRWGEPTISYAEGGEMFWAVPLMTNAEVWGGLVATVHEDVLFPGGSSRPVADLKTAATELRRLAERRNLTNAALLETRRWQYRREQERAEALQSFRVEGPIAVRQLYLQAEPRLMAAVRRGDRAQARAVLNQILTALLSAAGENFALVRGFCIELVATMCRTAVEGGGQADHLLASSYHGLSRLSEATSLETLAPVLHEALDRTVDAMERQRDSMQSVVIANALQHMRQRLGSALSRDAVAEAMCLSPSHFSRLFKKHTGRSFGEMLSRLRVDHAAELLVRSDLSIGQIATASGFPDASYFGKVFRRVMGTTPRAYRNDHDRRRGGTSDNAGQRE